MFAKIVVTVALIMVLAVCPVSGKTSDAQINQMSMDELTILEQRLKRILAIRKAEAQIDKVDQTDGQKTKAEKKRMDSTSFAPVSQTRPSASVAMPELPKPAPVVKNSFQRTGKTPVQASLPKIVSISGEEGNLTAKLELPDYQGIIAVNKGEKILDGAYTVKSITVKGVTVKDKSGGLRSLAFKSFETVNRSKGSQGSNSIMPLPLPSLKPIKIGGDATSMAPKQ